MKAEDCRVLLHGRRLRFMFFDVLGGIAYSRCSSSCRFAAGRTRWRDVSPV